VFSALVSYRNMKRQEKLEQAYKEEILTQVRRLLAIKQLSCCLKSRVSRKHELRMAQKWHSQYLYKTGYQAWISYYKKNALLIKKYLRYLKCHD
jgi:hypothetical protein